MSGGGRLVVLEGIDGSGTTTQAARLASALEARGVPTLLTCEPTPGPVGSLLREALGRRLRDPRGPGAVELGWDALALLFAADRLDHLRREILPALEAGRVVVCDRYVLSSLVYQSETSPEGAASLPFLAAANARARPADVTLVLDVDPEVAATRRAARGGPEELFEARELQARLARRYADARRLLPGARVLHVADGAPDEVAARVLEAALGA